MLSVSLFLRSILSNGNNSTSTHVVFIFAIPPNSMLLFLLFLYRPLFLHIGIASTHALWLYSEFIFIGLAFIIIYICQTHYFLTNLIFHPGCLPPCYIAFITRCFYLLEKVNTFSIHLFIFLVFISIKAAINSFILSFARYFSKK